MSTRPTQNESLHRAASDTCAEPTATSQTRRILVVDDNEDSAEAMAMMLERLGYQVSVALNGQASLDELQRLPVDVVLLDLTLPDMHGTLVAERMRAIGFSGKLIAVSGHSEASVKERCSRAGVDHFMVKPCSLNALRSLL